MLFHNWHQQLTIRWGTTYQSKYSLDVALPKLRYMTFDRTLARWIPFTPTWPTVLYQTTKPMQKAFAIDSQGSSFSINPSIDMVIPYRCDDVSLHNRETMSWEKFMKEPTTTIQALDPWLSKLFGKDIIGWFSTLMLSNLSTGATSSSILAPCRTFLSSHSPQSSALGRSRNGDSISSALCHKARDKCNLQSSLWSTSPNVSKLKL